MLFAVQIPVHFLFFIPPGTLDHECPAGNFMLTLFFPFHDIYFSKESCYKVHWDYVSRCNRAKCRKWTNASLILALKTV